jgi:hypothetical protein
VREKYVPGLLLLLLLLLLLATTWRGGSRGLGEERDGHVVAPPRHGLPDARVWHEGDAAWSLP